MSCEFKKAFKGLPRELLERIRDDENERISDRRMRKES